MGEGGLKWDWNLYDTETGIGGLIHLLLPEPIFSAETFHPGKYASIGFPIFLKALYGAAASPEKLKACVAGYSECTK